METSNNQMPAGCKHHHWNEAQAAPLFFKAEKMQSWNTFNWKDIMESKHSKAHQWKQLGLDGIFSVL